MIVADAIPMVVVVLQANFGEFAGIPSEIRRDPPTRGPLKVRTDDALIKTPFVGKYIIASQGRHPALSKTVRYLRVGAPIGQRFCRQCRKRRRDHCIAWKSARVKP